MLSALSWFSLQHDDDPGWCILDPVHRRCTQQMHKMMQICISVSRCISILASQIGLTRTNEPTPVTKQKPNTKFLFWGFWRINCNLSLQSNPIKNLPNQSSLSGWWFYIFGTDHQASRGFQLGFSKFCNRLLPKACRWLPAAALRWQCR